MYKMSRASTKSNPEGSGTADGQERVVTDKRLLKGEATRDRVLDAAERCFARDGFDAVSIRQIAADAEVTLGVVGFHCKSKQELFRTVLARRVEALNVIRRERLTELKAAPQGPAVHALVDAYLTPYLEYASDGDPQWRAYAALIARIVSDDRYYAEVRDLYDPVALEYLAEFQKLYPHAAKRQLATVLTLTVASLLSIVASRERIGGLSGQHEPTRPIDYRDMLIDFCAGGIERALST